MGSRGKRILPRPGYGPHARSTICADDNDNRSTLAKEPLDQLDESVPEELESEEPPSGDAAVARPKGSRRVKLVGAPRAPSPLVVAPAPLDLASAAASEKAPLSPAPLSAS